MGAILSKSSGYCLTRHVNICLCYESFSLNYDLKNECRVGHSLRSSRVEHEVLSRDVSVLYTHLNVSLLVCYLGCPS